MIRIKRAYDRVDAADGTRLLVDQLWPRGIKKENLGLTGWCREVAPSTTLRKWFGHDPDRWGEFRRKYVAELAKKPDTWRPLVEAAQKGDITLVYAAKDSEHNNAVVLRDYLQRKLKTKPSRQGR